MSYISNVPALNEEKLSSSVGVFVNVSTAFAYENTASVVSVWNGLLLAGSGAEELEFPLAAATANKPSIGNENS